MKWYFIIQVLLAIWVLIDGLERKANAVPWAMGTVLLGFIILPLYITERPLKAGEPRPGGIVLNFVKAFAVFWTILMAMSGIWRDKTNAGSVIKAETLEYKLAVLNTGGLMGEGDAAHFRSLLDQLSNSYGEDQQQIANISLIACNRIRHCDINESLLNIMEGLNDLSVYGDLKNKKYAEFAVEYATLRMAGQLHQEAIGGLQARMMGY